MSKNPLKSTLVFTVLGFLSPALNVFLLPIYLEYLPRDDFGIYTLMVALANFVGIVGTLKIDAAMRTYFFDYNDKPTELKKYLSNIFSFSILLAIGFWIVCYFLGPYLFVLFKNDKIDYFPFGILAVSIGLLRLCSAVYFTYLKNKIVLKEFAAYTILNVLATVSFQFFFIVIRQEGAVGALKGVFFSEIITFSILILSNWKLIIFSFDKKMIRESLSFSLLVIPFLFMNWFIFQGDRFMVEQYFSLEVVSQYALLLMIVGVLNMIMNALDSAIRPFLYEAYKKVKQKKIEINDYVQFYISIILLASSGIILIGNNLQILTQDVHYFQIIPYFTLAGFVIFLRAYTRIFNAQLFFVKESKSVTVLTFVNGVFLILCYFLLLPKFQIKGALYALVLANILSGLIFYFQAQKIFKVDYFMMRTIGLPIILFGVIFLFEFCANQAEWSSQIFGIVQFLLTISLVGVFYKKPIIRLWNDYVIK